MHIQGPPESCHDHGAFYSFFLPMRSSITMLTADVNCQCCCSSPFCQDWRFKRNGIVTSQKQVKHWPLISAVEKDRQQEKKTAVQTHCFLTECAVGHTVTCSNKHTGTYELNNAANSHCITQGPNPHLDPVLPSK